MAYSLKWAVCVLNCFCEAYPRATYIIFKRGGINTRQVLQSLILGASSWEQFKRLAKKIDSLPEFDLRLQIGELGPEILTDLGALHVTLCELQTYSPLDTQLELCFN